MTDEELREDLRVEIQESVRRAVDRWGRRFNLDVRGLIVHVEPDLVDVRFERPSSG